MAFFEVGMMLKIIGGCYGLLFKEFIFVMVKGVLDYLN